MTGDSTYFSSSFSTFLEALKINRRTRAHREATMPIRAMVLSPCNGLSKSTMVRLKAMSPRANRTRMMLSVLFMATVFSVYEELVDIAGKKFYGYGHKDHPEYLAQDAQPALSQNPFDLGAGLEHQVHKDNVY